MVACRLSLLVGALCGSWRADEERYSVNKIVWNLGWVAILALTSCSSGGLTDPLPAPGPGPRQDPGGCKADQHMCGGTCVLNSDPVTCGGGCTPCPVPENARATCDGTACGFSCAAGFHLCDSACVPEARPCGVPLPDGKCTDSMRCGMAGECIGTSCVCTAGYASCSAGCCPVSYSSTSLAGAAGRGVQLEFGADGTAYIMVQVSSGSDYSLQLYTRKPGKTTIERAALTIPVGYKREAWDFAIRNDGMLFAAVAPVSGEGSPVELHSWKEGMTSSTSERIGSAFGYNPGVGMTIDGKQTVWASWSKSRSGNVDAFSLELDGLHRNYTHSSAGTVEQTDVEWDPKGGGVFSFWGHRYTGTFSTGVAQLSGASGLANTCPADDAAIDSQGRMWAIYNSYSSIHTYFCAPGETIAASSAKMRAPALPTAFSGPIAIDGDDTAFVAYYDQSAYTAHWFASREGQRWARGTLPVRYGNPSGSTSPGSAVIGSARRPGSGRMSFVVLPSDATQGDMTLVDLQ